MQMTVLRPTKPEHLRIQATPGGWHSVRESACPHPLRPGSGSSPASRLGTASSGWSPAAPAPPPWRPQPRPWTSIPPTTPNTGNLNLIINGQLKRDSTEKVGRLSRKCFRILSDLSWCVDLPAPLLFQCHTLTLLSLSRGAAVTTVHIFGLCPHWLYLQITSKNPKHAYQATCDLLFFLF